MVGLLLFGCEAALLPQIKGRGWSMHVPFGAKLLQHQAWSAAFRGGEGARLGQRFRRVLSQRDPRLGRGALRQRQPRNLGGGRCRIGPGQMIEPRLLVRRGEIAAEVLQEWPRRGGRQAATPCGARIGLRARLIAARRLGAGAGGKCLRQRYGSVGAGCGQAGLIGLRRDRFLPPVFQRHLIGPVRIGGAKRGNLARPGSARRQHTEIGHQLDRDGIGYLGGGHQRAVPRTGVHQRQRILRPQCRAGDQGRRCQQQVNRTKHVLLYRLPPGSRYGRSLVCPGAPA